MIHFYLLSSPVSLVFKTLKTTAHCISDLRLHKSTSNLELKLEIFHNVGKCKFI